MSGASGQAWRGRQLHLIGVGGAGMSAYARAARALGATVTGSDRSPSPFAAALRADGVLDAAIGHAAANVPDGADVVASSAIPSDNVELETARTRGQRILTRAQLLAELTALRRTIAVAGAHGKTTTAAMIATVLSAAGAEPGYLIGASLSQTGRNGDWGSGEWLVVEADESDRSMLALAVEIAVVTSLELDHHSSFGSVLELEGVFRQFLAMAPKAVIWDRPELLALRGAAPVVAYDVPDAELDRGACQFRYDGIEIRLRVPGAHNALNAAAALEACRLAGVEPQQAAAALGGFRGAGRRFERLGQTASGATVYDDYAHHPTEVAASIAAARTLEPRRLIAAFQPHLYSRTQHFAAQFGAALAGAEAIVVVDVYPARERSEDFPGISGRTIAAATADAARGKPVYWLPSLDDAERVLRGLLGEGDILLVMGAGDIDQLGRTLADG